MSGIATPRNKNSQAKILPISQGFDSISRRLPSSLIFISPPVDALRVARLVERERGQRRDLLANAIEEPLRAHLRGRVLEAFDLVQIIMIEPRHQRQHH